MGSAPASEALFHTPEADILPVSVVGVSVRAATLRSSYLAAAQLCHRFQLVHPEEEASQSGKELVGQ
jgi:hypothetical protein